MYPRLPPGARKASRSQAHLRGCVRLSGERVLRARARAGVRRRGHENPSASRSCSDSDRCRPARLWQRRRAATPLTRRMHPHRRCVDGRRRRPRRRACRSPARSDRAAGEVAAWLLALALPVMALYLPGWIGAGACLRSRRCSTWRNPAHGARRANAAASLRRGVRRPDARDRLPGERLGRPVDGLRGRADQARARQRAQRQRVRKDGAVIAAIVHDEGLRASGACRGRRRDGRRCCSTPSAQTAELVA